MKYFQSSKNSSNKKVCQIIFVLETKSFTLFLITMMSSETAKITQNTTNIAHTKEAIGITIPSEVINFQILRFKQAIHLAEGHEDIKDGSKIILYEITKLNFLRHNRKNAEQFMKSILFIIAGNVKCWVGINSGQSGILKEPQEFLGQD